MLHVQLISSPRRRTRHFPGPCHTPCTVDPSGGAINLDFRIEGCCPDYIVRVNQQFFQSFSRMTPCWLVLCLVGSTIAARLLDLQPADQQVQVPIFELGSHPDPAEFYKRCSSSFSFQIATHSHNCPFVPASNIF
jgi:hypothetical protein